MDGFGTVMSSVVEVGLAPTLVLILVWKGFDFLNKYQKRLYELQIGQRIILEKLNAVTEYEDAIRELKVREKDE